MNAAKRKKGSGTERGRGHWRLGGWRGKARIGEQAAEPSFYGPAPSPPAAGPTFDLMRWWPFSAGSGLQAVLGTRLIVWYPLQSRALATSFLWQATGPAGEGSHPDGHKSACIHACYDATRVGVRLKCDLPGVLVAAVTVSPLVSGRWWRVIDHGGAGEGRVTLDRVSLSTRRNHEDSDPSITHLGSEWVKYCM